MRTLPANHARMPYPQPTTDLGDLVRGLKLKSDPQTVQQALQRHVDASPAFHGGKPHPDCPGCREIGKRLGNGNSE